MDIHRYSRYPSSRMFLYPLHLSPTSICWYLLISRWPWINPLWWNHVMDPIRSMWPCAVQNRQDANGWWHRKECWNFLDVYKSDFVKKVLGAGNSFNTSYTYYLYVLYVLCICTHIYIYIYRHGQKSPSHSLPLSLFLYRKMRVHVYIYKCILYIFIYIGFHGYIQRKQQSWMS